MRRVRPIFFISLGFAGFTALMLINAWMVDDAYITLRTVDNFVNGYGLRWNVAERAQAFTHPLWLAVLTPFYWITREGFFTSIIVSIALSLGAVVVAARALTAGFKIDLWKLGLFLLGLASCKAFLDYTSSGLENPLAYLVMAGAWVASLRGFGQAGDDPLKQVGRLAFFAALGFLVHPDLAIVLVPALLFAAVRARRRWPQVLWHAGIGSLPAMVWVAFSLVYYGFPLPNTVYAKAISTGLPIAWRVSRGLEYLLVALNWDAVGFAAVAAALGIAILRRHVGLALVCAGIILHMSSVVVTGASATHMGGRLFAVTLFLGWIAFVDALRSRRLGFAVMAALVVFLALSPIASVKFGTTAYKPVTTNASAIDTKFYAYREGAALLNWRRGLRMPNHAWYQAGEAARQSHVPVHVGGAPGSDAIGFFGFAAGPEVFIIDRLGLSDPLLARLPAIRPGTPRQWKSGHFSRAVPEGYVESAISEHSGIVDDQLRRRDDELRLVTRGPLLGSGRIRAVLALNLQR